MQPLSPLLTFPLELFGIFVITSFSCSYGSNLLSYLQNATIFLSSSLFLFESLAPAVTLTEEPQKEDINERGREGQQFSLFVSNHSSCLVFAYALFIVCFVNIWINLSVLADVLVILMYAILAFSRGCVSHFGLVLLLVLS